MISSKPTSFVQNNWRKTSYEIKFTVENIIPQCYTGFTPMRSLHSNSFFKHNLWNKKCLFYFFSYNPFPWPKVSWKGRLGRSSIASLSDRWKYSSSKLLHDLTLPLNLVSKFFNVSKAIAFLVKTVLLHFFQTFSYKTSKFLAVFHIHLVQMKDHQCCMDYCYIFFLFSNKTSKNFKHTFKDFRMTKWVLCRT